MEKLVHNTYEFVEFLDKVLKLDLSGLKLPGPETVTYHYTCHLRGIGVKDEGLKMLKTDRPYRLQTDGKKRISAADSVELSP